MNQEDSFWWQAVRHGEHDLAKLIPSQMLEERSALTLYFHMNVPNCKRLYMYIQSCMCICVWLLRAHIGAYDCDLVVYSYIQLHVSKQCTLAYIIQPQSSVARRSHLCTVYRKGRKSSVQFPFCV